MNESNQGQIDIWNGRVGRKWAEMQASLDAWVAPATAAIRARAGDVAGLRVLDLGCGNGATCTLWLADGASVTGVDVSDAMLMVAARRTGGKARLVRADAAIWRGETPFDLAVSQFGLMFFADPDMAFANIAANLRPGGRLLFTCWRAAAENEWVGKPMRAIRALLPAAPALNDALSGAPAPGPFALADRSRLSGIVERAGFTNLRVDPVDFQVSLGNEEGVEAAVRFVMQIGPTAAALAEAGKDLKSAAADRLRAALAPHHRGGLVTLGGAMWMVEATRFA